MAKIWAYLSCLAISEQSSADSSKKSKKKKLWEFRAKLHGKKVEKEEAEEVDDHVSKKLKKEAKIDDSRLQSYSASSKRKRK